MDSLSVIDGITIAFSIIAATFSIITWRCSILHDRKQATLEAYNQLQEQALDHLYMYTPTAIQEISKHPRSEEYKQIGFYIARIEHFCVGVELKIYDQKTVYELAHGFLDSAIKNRIMPIIERKSKGEYDYYKNTRNVLAAMDCETTKRKKKQK